MHRSMRPHMNTLSWVLLVLATAIMLLSFIWAFWARNYSGFTLDIEKGVHRQATVAFAVVL